MAAGEYHSNLIVDSSDGFCSPTYQQSPYMVSNHTQYYPATVSLPCDGMGFCETRGELIEYDDGQVYDYCIHCNKRVRLERVPGGVNLQKLKNLVASLLVEGEDVSKQYGDFSELMVALDEEAALLSEAQILLSISREILEKRSLDRKKLDS